MRAARDEILRRVGAWLGSKDFVRVGAGHFTRTRGDFVCHVGFQKLTSGRAVRVMCHITRGDDAANPISGPRSDAYERPNSPNNRKYHFGWSTRETDIARCVEAYCGYLDEVVLAWFNQQTTRTEA
ncbi:MAG: hypothetical protein RIC55_20035 [Pirellulaceae bacterium]